MNRTVTVDHQWEKLGLIVAALLVAVVLAVYLALPAHPTIRTIATQVCDRREPTDDMPASEECQIVYRTTLQEGSR